MARGTTVTFYRTQDLYLALSRLPREAKAELRIAAKAIAQVIADDARGRAQRLGGVAGLVAPTIRAKSDTVPTIVLGNARKLPLEGSGWKRKSRGGDNQTFADIVWGAEFGGARGTRSARRTTQFLPWTGNDESAGYFLYPAVRDNTDFMAAEYMAAMERAETTALRVRSAKKR